MQEGLQRMGSDYGDDDEGGGDEDTNADMN